VIRIFKGKRYVTIGVTTEVPVALQLHLWNLVDLLVTSGEVEPDYLQIFELKPTTSGGQRILHRQEVPPFFAEIVFDNFENPIDIKLYVIDDGEYSTMLLPEER
jgi:hypothetical protein